MAPTASPIAVALRVTGQTPSNPARNNSPFTPLRTDRAGLNRALFTQDVASGYRHLLGGGQSSEAQRSYTHSLGREAATRFGLDGVKGLGVLFGNHPNYRATHSEYGFSEFVRSQLHDENGVIGQFMSMFSDHAAQLIGSIADGINGFGKMPTYTVNTYKAWRALHESEDIADPYHRKNSWLKNLLKLGESGFFDGEKVFFVGVLVAYAMGYYDTALLCALGTQVSNIGGFTCPSLAAGTVIRDTQHLDRLQELRSEISHVRQQVREADMNTNDRIRAHLDPELMTVVEDLLVELKSVEDESAQQSKVAASLWQRIKSKWYGNDVNNGSATAANSLNEETLIGELYPIIDPEAEDLTDVGSLAATGPHVELAELEDTKNPHELASKIQDLLLYTARQYQHGEMQLSAFKSYTRLILSAGLRAIKKLDPKDMPKHEIEAFKKIAHQLGQAVRQIKSLDDLPEFMADQNAGIATEYRERSHQLRLDFRAKAIEAMQELQETAILISQLEEELPENRYYFEWLFDIGTGRPLFDKLDRKRLAVKRALIEELKDELKQRTQQFKMQVAPLLVQFDDLTREIQTLTGTEFDFDIDDDTDSDPLALLTLETVDDVRQVNQTGAIVTRQFEGLPKIMISAAAIYLTIDTLGSDGIHNLFFSSLPAVANMDALLSLAKGGVHDIPGWVILLVGGVAAFGSSKEALRTTVDYLKKRARLSASASKFYKTQIASQLTLALSNLATANPFTRSLSFGILQPLAKGLEWYGHRYEDNKQDRKKRKRKYRKPIRIEPDPGFAAK